MLIRFSNIILAIILVFSTGGIKVYKHYCGDELSGKTIFVEPENCCGEHCNKCRNEGKFFQVKENYVQREQLVINKAFNSFINLFTPLQNIFSINPSEIILSKTGYVIRSIPLTSTGIDTIILRL